MTSPSINAAVPTQAAAGKTNKAAAMVDARFFLTSDLEAAIAQLPGVRGVRIVAPEAEIEEIHIMASTEVRPKTIVRNVCTLLLVRFGVRLDHRRISIVQADAQPDHQLARPVIYDVRHTHADDGAVVSVELRCSGQRTYGKCRIDENTSAICAGGLALIEAVENLIARHGELDLREARLVTLQEHELVLVLVSWHGALAEELFVGAAFTTGDRASASARATLDAINRKLVRLPLALVG